MQTAELVRLHMMLKRYREHEIRERRGSSEAMDRVLMRVANDIGSRISALSEHSWLTTLLGGT